MDPLSNVLSLLKPRNYLSAGLDAGGDWAIQFPDQQQGIKCGAVVVGECWLSVKGVSDPVHLVAGDSFLLPTGRPFRLASDMSVQPVEGDIVFSAPCKPGITTYNGGGGCFLLTSRFALDGDQANVLLRMLPPIVHIADEAGQAALHWPVERMMRELKDPQPGGFLIVQHLAQMMLIEALRLHLSEGLKGGVGWLFALADKQMSMALSAMHDDPAHRWTLQELATHVGMSRSSFAKKFRETVGSTPMDYLAHWRMLLAADRLQNSSDPISIIAPSLGYYSDTSFSMAFKKIVGCSPRRYGRGEGPIPRSVTFEVPALLATG